MTTLFTAPTNEQNIPQMPSKPSYAMPKTVDMPTLPERSLSPAMAAALAAVRNMRGTK